MKFISLIPVYLHKVTIRLCMGYFCPVWTDAPSCYLDMLDNLQKWVCGIDGPTLASSLEHIGHRRNTSSSSLCSRCYFGRCFSELAELFRLPYSHGSSALYSDRLHDFSVTISRCYKGVYVKTFFSAVVDMKNANRTKKIFFQSSKKERITHFNNFVAVKRCRDHWVLQLLTKLTGT